MVRIIGYKKSLSEEGQQFFSLKVQGGIEMVKSVRNGNFYATARRTLIMSTFDEETCKALIGTEIEGSVQRKECDIYQYTLPETGEVIELAHTYVYHNEIMKKKGEVKADVSTFSSNGVNHLQGV